MPRRIGLAVLGWVFAAGAWGLAAGAQAAAAVPGAPAVSQAAAAASIEAGSLRSIAGWLKQSGADGYLAADVADAMGIPRLPSEALVAARQRGFRNPEALRIAQVPADGSRDFIVFMVQQPDDQVYFYFSTVREGLKKALVSIPSRNLVLPLAPLEAELRFREEVHYWGERVENR